MGSRGDSPWKLSDFFSCRVQEDAKIPIPRNYNGKIPVPETVNSQNPREFKGQIPNPRKLKDWNPSPRKLSFSQIPKNLKPNSQSQESNWPISRSRKTPIPPPQKVSKNRHRCTGISPMGINSWLMRKTRENINLNDPFSYHSYAKPWLGYLW